MHVQLFTLRFSDSLGGFDTTALERFLTSREVLRFREHFFEVHEVPHLLCIVTWQLGELSPVRKVTGTTSRPASAKQRAADEDKPTSSNDEAIAELLEDDRRVFEALRAWRRDKAHDEGVPPYIVFTNRQLLEMVRARPDSPNGLGQLRGIGKGKLQKYASEVLELLAAQAAAVPAGTPDAKDGGSDE